jgi:hypothetical protein
LRKANRGLDGRWVYIDHEFDSCGRNHRVSEPYFAGNPVYWTTIDAYDGLDRVIKTTDADNRTDQVIYDGLVVTSIVDSSGKNQQKVEERDSLGNLIRVTDNALLRDHRENALFPFPLKLEITGDTYCYSLLRIKVGGYARRYDGRQLVALKLDANKDIHVYHVGKGEFDPMHFVGNQPKEYPVSPSPCP